MTTSVTRSGSDPYAFGRAIWRRHTQTALNRGTLAGPDRELGVTIHDRHTAFLAAAIRRKARPGTAGGAGGDWPVVVGRPDRYDPQPPDMPTPPTPSVASRVREAEQARANSRESGLPSRGPAGAADVHGDAPEPGVLDRAAAGDLRLGPGPDMAPLVHVESHPPERMVAGAQAVTPGSTPVDAAVVARVTAHGVTAAEPSHQHMVTQPQGRMAQGTVLARMADGAMAGGANTSDAVPLVDASNSTDTPDVKGIAHDAGKDDKASASDTPSAAASESRFTDSADVVSAAHVARPGTATGGTLTAASVSGGADGAPAYPLRAQDRPLVAMRVASGAAQALQSVVMRRPMGAPLTRGVQDAPVVTSPAALVKDGSLSRYVVENTVARAVHFPRPVPGHPYPLPRGTGGALAGSSIGTSRMTVARSGPTTGSEPNDKALTKPAMPQHATTVARIAAGPVTHAGAKVERVQTTPLTPLGASMEAVVRTVARSASWRVQAGTGELARMAKQECYDAPVERSASTGSADLSVQRAGGVTGTHRPFTHPETSFPVSRSPNVGETVASRLPIHEPLIARVPLFDSGLGVSEATHVLRASASTLSADRASLNVDDGEGVAEHGSIISPDAGTGTQAVPGVPAAVHANSTAGPDTEYRSPSAPEPVIERAPLAPAATLMRFARELVNHRAAERGISRIEDVTRAGMTRQAPDSSMVTRASLPAPAPATVQEPLPGVTVSHGSHAVEPVDQAAVVLSSPAVRPVARDAPASIPPPLLRSPNRSSPLQTAGRPGAAHVNHEVPHHAEGSKVARSLDVAPVHLAAARLPALDAASGPVSVMARRPDSHAATRVPDFLRIFAPSGQASWSAREGRTTVQAKYSSSTAMDPLAFNGATTRYLDAWRSAAAQSAGEASQPAVVDRLAEQYGVVPIDTQRAASQPAAAPLPAAAAGPSAAAGNGAGKSPPDANALAEQAWQIIQDKLAIERERRGYASWP